jgi:hypothetical protein
VRLAVAPVLREEKPGASVRNSAALERGTARSSPMSRLNSDAARAGPVPRTVRCPHPRPFPRLGGRVEKRCLRNGPIASKCLGCKAISRHIARLPFAWTISPPGVLHPSPEAGEGTGMGASFRHDFKWISAMHRVAGAAPAAPTNSGSSRRRSAGAPWTRGGRNPGMGFIQTPPQLGNQYRDDRVLRGTSRARSLPTCSARSRVTSTRSASSRAVSSTRCSSPTGSTSPCSPRGTRGATAWTTSSSPPCGSAPRPSPRSTGSSRSAYERRHGALSRVDQFARVHLFTRRRTCTPAPSR